MDTKVPRLKDLKIEVGQDFNFKYCAMMKNGNRLWTKVTITRLSRGYEVFVKPTGYEFPILKKKMAKATTLESIYSQINELA